MLNLLIAGLLGYSIASSNNDEVLEALMQSNKESKIYYEKMYDTFKYEKYPTMCVDYIKAEDMYVARIATLPKMEFKPIHKVVFLPSRAVEVRTGRREKSSLIPEKYIVDGVETSADSYKSALAENRAEFERRVAEIEGLKSKFTDRYKKEVEDYYGKRNEIVCGSWPF